MKSKLVSIFCLFLSIIGCKNQNDFSQAEIFFPKKEIWVDTIKYKSIVTTEFPFYNTSHNTLIIEATVSTCQCTLPVVTKDTVESGKSGKIQIQITTDRLGSFRQPILVYYNGNNSPDTISVSGIISINNGY